MVYFITKYLAVTCLQYGKHRTILPIYNAHIQNGDHDKFSYIQNFIHTGNCSVSPIFYSTGSLYLVEFTKLILFRSQWSSIAKSDSHTEHQYVWILRKHTSSKLIVLQLHNWKSKKGIMEEMTSRGVHSFFWRKLLVTVCRRN